MNIIEKYIETNKSLLDDLVASDPTLASGVIDALAVLNNYINNNNIEFTEEEESKMLIPANIEEIKREEERTAKELQLAEEQSKEIQQSVAKIDEVDLNGKSCTYVFVRDWLGNKLNSYFILGVTNDAKADTILFSTFLKDDVFTDNPTPANTLIRQEFISKSRLRYVQLGTWIWKLRDTAIKSPNIVSKDWQNQIKELSQEVSKDFETRLLIDNDRNQAIEIFTRGAKNLTIYDNLRALALPYYLNHALNTIQMVAWAEGIDLRLNAEGNFIELGNYLDMVIDESKRKNERLYVVLARDSKIRKSEMRSAFGSTLAEQLVKSYNENDAFVVAILVDGAFQDGVDPYMFSQPVAQTNTNVNKQLTPLGVLKVKAKEKSLLTSENVYIIKNIDGSVVYEIGESNANKLISSPDFYSVLAVYKDGNEISVPPMLPSPSTPFSTPPIEETMSRAEAEARDRALKASKITTEKCYVVELQNGKFGMEVGDEDAITISESNQFESLVAVYQDGVILEIGMIPTPKELDEEITEEDLKDLAPIELHIKNKDALKTDFSLLEDINFDDEE